MNNKTSKKSATAVAASPAAEKSNELKKPKNNHKKLFGVLGKDLSSQFSPKGNRAWRPTKPGGRNGQGKP